MADSSQQGTAAGQPAGGGVQTGTEGGTGGGGGAAGDGESTRRQGLVQGFWFYLFGDSAQKQNPTGAAGTTERVIQTLWLLVAAGLGVELAYGLSLDGWERGAYFVVWAWTASLAAALAGAFLGLLFGLPSLPIARPSTRVETPPVHGAGAGGAGAGDSDGSSSGPGAATVTVETPSARVEQELPYNESSSLEQIADWLTKIIVGLTLTQYESWSARFETLSQGLTFRLLGRQDDCTPAALCEPSQSVPGASIILAFSVLGFLVTYLWMRRFFIIEMVVGKRQALEVMQARANVQLEQQRALAAEATRRVSQAQIETKQAQQAEADKLVAQAHEMGTAQVSPLDAPAASAKAVDDVLANAAKLLPEESREALARIEAARAQAVNPDDPWAGLFGGSAEAGGVRLTAAVTPLPGSAHYFEIKLEAAALTPERTASLPGTSAWFFLHPTFRDKLRPVTFGADARAPLQLYAWGAFTVGVLLQDGTTLEINLATIPYAPDVFRSR